MAEKNKQKTAIIVGTFSPIYNAIETQICDLGAGVGGVATAARLAKAGFKVTVVEKNDFTGGRCSLLHHEGYVSFDTQQCYLR
jgi:heterodisulfide reductase subunit A-like polyferredoxin